MRDHIEPREVAAGARHLGELVVEAGVDIDALVGRAVERPHRRGRAAAAPGRHAAIAVEIEHRALERDALAEMRALIFELRPGHLEELGLEPIGWFHSWAAAGCDPSRMGIGPVPATQAVMKRAGLTVDQMDVIELNEAFAAQSLAVMRALGLDDDDARINPNGGAIALGHPLGMSGTRLVITATRELKKRGGRYALCTMCVGVGQGVALILENLN